MATTMKLTVEHEICREHLVWAAVHVLIRIERAKWTPFPPEAPKADDVLAMLRSAIADHGSMMSELAGPEWPIGFEEWLPDAEVIVAEYWPEVL